MKKHIHLFILIAFVFLLAACNSSQPTVMVPTAVTTYPEAETAPAGETTDPVEVTEPIDPTAVSEIIPVARVNGEDIPESLFQPQLNMLLEVDPVYEPAPVQEEAQTLALDNLVRTILLAQGARENGFVISAEILDNRLQTLTSQAGGEEALNTWMQTYGYTSQSLRMQLSLEIEAEAMREIIFESVPRQQEQMEAHDFLFEDAYSAQRILGQLMDGTSYEIVQANNDPYLDGYLGWFPRGYLFDAVIEDAAFSVDAPGYYGEVIENDAGYHVIYVLSREPAREVSPNALLELREQALLDWMEQEYTQSSIEILLP